MAATSYKSNDSLEFIQNLSDFQNYIDDSKNIVKRKSKNLRDDIQNIIKTVKKQQDPLFYEVSVYEKKCLREADEKIHKEKLFLKSPQNKVDINIDLSIEQKKWL